jgi:serine/threonine protein kinase
MTSFCPNYRCLDRSQPDTAEHCGSCYTPLVINGKYRLTKPIRTSPEKATDSHPAFYWTELFRLRSNDTTPDRLLKILVIKPDYLQDPSSALELQQVRTRFSQEFQLLQRHLPGVCQGYELLEILMSDGLYSNQAIMMEYVDGINLDEYVQRYGAIDSQHALRWLEQLIAIIGTLHQHQIQHRDIKPSNIIVAGRGLGEKLVIIDLGIALDLTNSMPTEVLGTPPFADPSYLNEPKPYQNNFDFYSLGMTFVYILTGGSTEQNWLTKVVCPDLDPKLRNVIQRLIANDDYQQRFTSADEIQQFLQPAGAVTANRSPKWLKILGLVILGLTCTLLFFWRTHSQPTISVFKKEYVHEICPLMVEQASVKCGDAISSEFSSVFPDIPDAFLELASPKKEERQAAVKKYENALNEYKKRTTEREAIGEITIYLNNARVQANYQDIGQQIYTLLVAVPKYDKPRGVKSNILSGVAQVQKHL